MRIPGEGQEELDGELHRLQVADIHDPDAVGAVFVGEVHLLPDLGDGNGVEPLVGARIADVVEVVVDARAAGALAFVGRRQAAEVAPVVVAPEQGDVVGHAHAVLVVFLHLLVERPDLAARRSHRLFMWLAMMARWSATIFSSSAMLALLRHGQVAVAAHAERDDAFVVLVALDAFGPELVQRGCEFVE